MSADRLASFRRVLAAALGTSYYRPRLEAASLANPEQIMALASIEEGLTRLPPLDPSLLTRHPELFRNPNPEPVAAPVLKYPNGQMPRVAVLSANFRPTRCVRVFPNGWSWRLAWYRPQGLAGPLEKLNALAAALQAGIFRMPPLTHAVIVFTRVDQPAMGKGDRERLWAAFQVPVYEQIVGFAGELLAWECEAHEGLHICPEDAVVENGSEDGRLLVTSLVDTQQPVIRLIAPFSGHTTGALCGCGQPGERLLLAERKACAADG